MIFRLTKTALQEIFADRIGGPVFSECDSQFAIHDHQAVKIRIARSPFRIDNNP
jgi:hypothetical protein